MSPDELESSGSVSGALRRYFSSSAPDGVVSAYLFGSVARDADHLESDVDVAVLLDRTLHPHARQRSELCVSLTSELIHALERNDVDVVVLNDAPPELGRRIVTEGERVHVDAVDADRDFVRDVQLRAADLDPFLARMRRIRLETLRR